MNTDQCSTATLADPDAPFGDSSDHAAAASASAGLEDGVASSRGAGRRAGTVSEQVGRAMPWLLAAGTAAAVAATFAPWLHTGSARRSSYAVVRAAERLQVFSAGRQAVVSVTWAFLPLVAVLVLAALLWRRPRLACVLALTVGAAEASLALVVAQAPQVADWGTTAGATCGLVLVATALLGLVTARADRSMLDPSGPMTTEGP